MGVQPPPFSIAVDGDHDRVLITVRGELDLATSPELESAVLGRLDDGTDVVVDLRELDFIDSSGVRVLVTAHTRAKDGGGRFVIVRAERTSEVDRVIVLSGLDSELTLVDDPSALD